MNHSYTLAEMTTFKMTDIIEGARSVCLRDNVLERSFLVTYAGHAWCFAVKIDKRSDVLGTVSLIRRYVTNIKLNQRMTSERVTLVYNGTICEESVSYPMDFSMVDLMSLVK